MNRRQKAIEIICFGCNLTVRYDDLACQPICKPCRAAMKEYPNDNFCSDPVREVVKKLYKVASHISYKDWNDKEYELLRSIVEDK